MARCKAADGGYIDSEGRLFWEGRLDDIIKTGGANVSPIELDTVIRELEGVKAAQSVGVPDDLLGELAVSCIVQYEGEASGTAEKSSQIAALQHALAIIACESSPTSSARSLSDVIIPKWTKSEASRNQKTSNAGARLPELLIKRPLTISAC